MSSLIISVRTISGLVGILTIASTPSICVQVLCVLTISVNKLSFSFSSAQNLVYSTLIFDAVTNIHVNFNEIMRKCLLGFDGCSVQKMTV